MEYSNFYNQECRSIKDTRHFPKVKSQVMQFMHDPRCPADMKIIFGEWFFTKLKMLIRMPANLRKELTEELAPAVEECKSPIIKSMYIYYHNIDASMELMHYFYNNRFNDVEFILQMVNDSNLLKYQQNLLPIHELKAHFLMWIRSTPCAEQQSNLLDVLLRHFSADDEVMSIYKKMKGGDSVYQNAQSAHDEDITFAVRRAIGELAEWHSNNLPPEVIREESPMSPSDFTKNVIGGGAKTKEHKRTFNGIWERMMIDRTSIKVDVGKNETRNVSAFDVLFMLANLIRSHPSRAEITTVLYDEMRAMVELCISGYFARFMMTLRGFDERFQITIPFFKQLYSKISSDVMKAVKKLPDDCDIITGTYDEKYKKDYVQFIVNTINVSSLTEQYGADDVAGTLPRVMNKFMGEEGWSIDNNKVAPPYKEEELKEEVPNEKVKKKVKRKKTRVKFFV